MTASVIRAAAVDELDALAAMHREAFDEAWSAAAIGELLAMPGAVGLVIAGDAAPEGFVLLRVGGGEAEILTLAVRARCRRRGHGHALVVAAMEHCVLSGAQTMFLEVAVDNRPALGLYHRLGFEDAGRRRAYYSRGPGLSADALVLKKKLSPAQVGLGKGVQAG